LNQASASIHSTSDALFLGNLVAAGEQAGILETLLDRLADVPGKDDRAQGERSKKRFFYPVSIILVGNFGYTRSS